MPSQMLFKLNLMLCIFFNTGIPSNGFFESAACSSSSSTQTSLTSLFGSPTSSSSSSFGSPPSPWSVTQNNARHGQNNGNTGESTKYWKLLLLHVQITYAWRIALSSVWNSVGQVCKSPVCYLWCTLSLYNLSCKYFIKTDFWLLMMQY